MKILPYILIFITLLAAGGLYLEATSKNSTMPLVTVGNTPLQSLFGKEKTMHPEFKNYGKAPEFTGIEHWLNSDPLTMESLRGNVVLIDFWTFSCINCIRTLPYVTKWYDTYKDKGLIIVGVHTPEFAFEKDAGNVQDAIRRFNIHYPVAQDNNFGTWSAYSNRYWPAEYLIDQEGNIVYTHFGEGNYDVTEKAIRTLLKLDGKPEAKNPEKIGRPGTPEIYFGLSRLEYLTTEQVPLPEVHTFTLPQNLSANTFALEGKWQFDQEKSTLVHGPGKIQLNYYAGQIHMVAKSEEPITIKILVDGKEVNAITVKDSMLYTLYDSQDYGAHILEIQIPEAGFEAFTFTFG